MGRCFSTVYRIVLVAVSVSALVLSILSATSCQFVKFDHQYKSDYRRFLFETKFGLGDRSLQETETMLPADDTTEGDPTPADSIVDSVTAPADDTTYTSPAESPAESPAMPESTTPAESPATPESTTPASVSAPESTTPASVSAPDATAPADSPVPDVTAPAESPVPDTTITIEPPATPETAPPPSTPADTVPAPGPAVDDPEDDLEDPTDTVSDPTVYPPEIMSVFEDDEEEEEAPVAQVSGDAGLFCDGTKSLSITNLWGGNMAEFEEEIAKESDKNSSEELARNAVIAAAVFGLIVSFVLILESLVGWRVWCEKWIVGLISLMACVSQGVTFLFFNSERYCDGDIVNEIINQEPCVFGQGAIYSVIALVLYAIMIGMSCRLPQDNPYGLCCKKNRDSGKSDTASERSGKFGLLGSKSSAGEDGTTAPDQKPERPNWLSEENGRKVEEDEENEVI